MSFGLALRRNETAKGETEKNRHTRDKQVTYIVAKNSMKTGKTDGGAERKKPRGRRKHAVGSKPVVGRHL